MWNQFDDLLTAACVRCMPGNACRPLPLELDAVDEKIVKRHKAIFRWFDLSRFLPNNFF